MDFHSKALSFLSFKQKLFFPSSGLTPQNRWQLIIYHHFLSSSIGGRNNFWKIIPFFSPSFVMRLVARTWRRVWGEHLTPWIPTFLAKRSTIYSTPRFLSDLPSWVINTGLRKDISPSFLTTGSFLYAKFFPHKLLFPFLLFPPPTETHEQD